MHILSLNGYPPPRADTFPSPGLATDFVSQRKKKTLKAREAQYKKSVSMICWSVRSTPDALGSLRLFQDYELHLPGEDSYLSSLT